MADLTITTTNVVPDDGADLQEVEAGEVIDAGEMVYLDTADESKAKLALCGGSALQATMLGMAMSNAVVAGQRILVAKTGATITIGAGTLGAVYVLSSTGGKISPEADLATTEYLSIVGYCSAANKLTLNIINTGVQHA